LDELVARRADLGRLLELPNSDESVHVYLFENADRFEQFMELHHPDLPLRRAFFLETDTRLAIYAQWGDRVAEDLRHEVTHGYLHAVVPNLPLWLDEGLAEYFEVPRGYGGLNRVHVQHLLARMQRHQWSPDLARLERLDATGDLSQEDYAESWAWVHFLLHDEAKGRDLLRSFLADLRRDGAAEPLSKRIERVVPSPAHAVQGHVLQLAEH
jgi:hypothetical protein